MKINKVINVMLIVFCLEVGILSVGFKPLSFRIDLDQDLKPQYENIYPHYKEPLERYVEYVESYPGYSELSEIATELLGSQPKVYQEEILMLSEVTGVPVSVLTIGNMAYEISCTSLVVNHGDTVFMGRNFDFFPRDILADLIYEIDAYRNNTLIYKANNVFGNVGVININVNGKFGATLDQSFGQNPSELRVNRTLNGYLHPLYYLRVVAETATDYDDAVRLFQGKNVTSPVYFIIGGIKRDQGTVIASRPVTADLVSTIQPGDWYIVETNYDLDKPDPPSDPRRTVAQNRLNKLGENNTNFETIVEDVLGLYPNRNNITIYTCVFSASEGYFNTTVYNHGITQ